MRRQNRRDSKKAPMGTGGCILKIMSWMVRRQQWCETVGGRKRMADERGIGCAGWQKMTKVKGKGGAIKRGETREKKKYDVLDDEGKKQADKMNGSEKLVGKRRQEVQGLQRHPGEEICARLNVCVCVCV